MPAKCEGYDIFTLSYWLNLLLRVDPKRVLCIFWHPVEFFSRILRCLSKNLTDGLQCNRFFQIYNYHFMLDYVESIIQDPSDIQPILALCFPNFAYRLC